METIIAGAAVSCRAPEAAFEHEQPQDCREAEGDKWERATRMLRRIGAVILAASSLAFILQGWSDTSPSMLPYYSFLGFTVLLAAAGFFCGLKLKEAKGARTFLGVAAAFLPAHFAQLGALLFSLSGKAPAGMPQIFVFVAPSAAQAWTAVAVASAVLIPIVFTGFSSLARRQAAPLTAIFFAANAMLLLPYRACNVVALLAFAAFAGIILLDRILFSAQPAMKTWEGRAVRTVLFTPIVLMVGRSVLYYPVTLLMVSILLGIAAFLMYFVLPSVTRNDSMAEFAQVLAIGPCAASWAVFIAAIFYADSALLPLSASVGEKLLLPLTALPLSAIVAGLSFFAVGSGRGYRKFAAGTAVASMLVNLFVVGGVLASLLCIVTAVAVIMAAFATEERGLLQLGCAGLLLGLGYHLRYALDVYELSPWLTLAVTGTLIVIASSYVERNYRTLTAKIEVFNKRVGQWS